MKNKDWLLVMLKNEPLTRLQLMKSLFLFWYRNQAKLLNFYEFKPYLYGPCSFEVYDDLRILEKEHLISRSLMNNRWDKYHITETGKNYLSEIDNLNELIVVARQTAQELSSKSTSNMLHKVYSEAPEYTHKSLIREEIL